MIDSSVIELTARDASPIRSAVCAGCGVERRVFPYKGVWLQGPHACDGALGGLGDARGTVVAQDCGVGE